MLEVFIIFMMFGLITIVHNIEVLQDNFIKSYSYIIYPIFIIYSIILLFINLYVFISYTYNVQKINKTTCIVYAIVLLSNWIDILIIKIKCKYFNNQNK